MANKNKLQPSEDTIGPQKPLSDYELWLVREQLKEAEKVTWLKSKISSGIMWVAGAAAFLLWVKDWLRAWLKALLL